MECQRFPRGHRATALAAFTACALSLASCVAPTNPYDEATPPDLQVPGHIVGTVAFPSLQGEAPRAPNGIRVWAQLVGAAEPATEVTTVDGAAGRFDLEVNPGNYFISADHPAFGQATAGPVRLAPAANIDVGVLELRAAEPNAALSGSVVAQGGLSAAGIEVSLVHLLDDNNCGAVEAKTNTTADGAYRFDAVRPGDYAVVAKTEGATVDVLVGADKVTLAANEDKDLALDGKELVVQPAPSVITVAADGVSPTETSRTRDLGLTVLGFDGVQQMQLGGDPTFDPALGGTGWQPYTESLPFTLPDEEGEWNVYAQMRSSCATSPLYSARVFFDASPPEIISAQAGTAVWDPFSPEPPLVVVGSGLAGVSVTLNVIDATGVDEARFIVNGDMSATQVETVDGQPGQALVRATAFIPVDERRYRLRIELVDLAGNATAVDASPLFDVLRDISPPTTPVPVASAYSSVGDRALVWLAERDCPGGSRGWVCEANPHPQGGFLVRGGPALLDFTSFDAPPFDVPLFDDGTTVIEIIARDAGNQQSPGTARVDVTRREAKTLFTAPVDKQLGLPLDPVADYGPQIHLPPLTPGQQAPPLLLAQGGHAFFSLRHRPNALADTFYSYLIAQPASAPDVGLSPGAGPHPAGVRKLNVSTDSYWDEYYDRVVAGLGTGAGALTWLESWPDYYWFQSQWARRYLLYADGDGTYDVSTKRRTTFAAFDADGEPAPDEVDANTCEQQGATRCAYDRYAWSAVWTQAPAESTYDGRSFITAGSSTRAFDLVGSDEGSQDVSGPAVVLLSVPDPDEYVIRPVLGLYASIQARAGSVLMSGFYTSSGSTWRGQPDNDAVDFVANVMTGSGRELFRAPEDYEVNYSDRAFGIYVPAGETISVPLVSLPTTDVMQPAGLIAREFADESEAGQFNKVDPNGLDRADVVPAFTLLLGDRDPMRLGEHNGITIANWGEDADPYPNHHATATDVADVDQLVQLAEQQAGLLAPEQSGISAAQTATSDELYTPSNGCTLLVRAEEDVALRSIRVPGAGLLDYLRVGIWELEGVSPLGVYERTVINPQATPDQAFLYPSVPDDISGCDDNNVVQQTDQLTGNVTVDTVVLHQETINATQTVAQSANWSDGGLLLDGEWVIAGSVPVNPGQRVVVAVDSPGTTGDLDAYLGWNDPPPLNQSPGYADDEYSGAYGSVESFDEIAPGDATAVYIWVYAYPSYGDVAGWTVDIEVTEGTGPLEIAEFDLQLNDVIEVETTGANGDIDLYLSLDDWWPADYDRARSRNAGSDETLTLHVDDDYETHVYVTVDQVTLPADFEITVRRLRPVLQQLGSYPVTAGQAVTVSTSGTERSIPYVRFDAAPDAVAFDCTDDFGGSGTTADCTAYAPSGATTAYVAITGDGAATDFTADVEVADSGCSEVRVESQQGRGTLRAGRTYAISLSDFIYFNSGPLEWDERNPSIFRGAPQQTDYLTVLGEARDVYSAGASLIVPSVDTGGPHCRVDFDIVSRSQYRALSSASGAVAAVRELTEPDGTRSATVVTGAVADASLAATGALTTVERLPAGWSVLATQVHEGRAYWVQADADGRRASVRSALIGPAQPTSCEVAPLAADLAAANAAWDGDRLVVAGRQGGADGVRVYDLDPSVGACGALVSVGRRALPGPSTAVAISGGDLFAWTEPESTGGALVHHDVRALVPVHPGGADRVLGADGMGDDTYLSAYPALDPTRGRLEHLVVDDEGALTASRTLAQGGAYLQPRALTAGVAYVSPQALTDGADPSVWLLANTAGAMPVSLDPGTALDNAPGYDVDEPSVWNATPLLESDGDVLALLGWDAQGARHLRIYEVPADPGGWMGLLAAHDVALDNVSEVATLSVSGGVVVVTFRDIDEPARAFFAASGASGLWEEAWVGARDTERVIGAVAGELLVMENPGDLFAPQPPPWAAVTTRAPGATPVTPSGVLAPMRAPSSLYLHTFTATGASPAGDVLLFDESALSPVLWRIDAAHGRSAPADGPRRPLNQGAESLGVASLPRVAGDGLLFLRAEEAGIALLRERL